MGMEAQVSRFLLVIIFVIVFLFFYFHIVFATNTPPPEKDSSVSSEDKDQKFLKQLYEGMSPELKQRYSVPGIAPPPAVTPPPAPSSPPPASSTTKESPLEKLLEILFGKTESYFSQEQGQENLLGPLKRQLPEDDEPVEGLDPLQQIIENAKVNSPEIKKAKIEAEIIRRQNTFIPVPVFSVGNDFATGKMLISAGIQVPLEPLFTGKQREQYSLLLVRQKEIEVEQKVIEQYTVVKQIKKKLKNRQEKAHYANELVKIAQEQYKGGVIRLEELIKVKELLWQIEQDIESLQLSLQAEVEKLRSIEYGAR